MFLASGPLIETMMQWRPLTALNDFGLVSTTCYCLNFQQRMKKDENPRPKLISPIDIEGKISKIHNGVCCN